jgi:hypothetical protein
MDSSFRVCKYNRIYIPTFLKLFKIGPYRDQKNVQKIKIRPKDGLKKLKIAQKHF